MATTTDDCYSDDKRPMVTVPTAEQIRDARGWISDCIDTIHGVPTDEYLAETDDDGIVRMVSAEYDGGWTQFIIDGRYNEGED